MRAFYKGHKRAIFWGAVILLALWALWYSRPVNIRFLMGRRQEAAFIEVSVNPQAKFPKTDFRTLNLAVDAPEAEALMNALEDLRFHRSPLEPLLRLLPPMGSASKTVEPEKDYMFYLFFSSEEQEHLQNIRFWIDEWSYGPYGELPLFVFHGQERGRELGALMTELSTKPQFAQAACRDGTAIQK